MKSEIDFLKYLDKELSAEERLEVEREISDNSSQKKLFEKVKYRREQMLKSLDTLNPDEDIIIPDFIVDKEVKSTAQVFARRFVFKTWHYAAGIAVLIALAGIFWLNDVDLEEKQIADLVHEVQTESSPFESLNYDISPNRCWNKRQLVWTLTNHN